MGGEESKPETPQSASQNSSFFFLPPTPPATALPSAPANPRESQKKPSAIKIDAKTREGLRLRGRIFTEVIVRRSPFASDEPLGLSIAGAGPTADEADRSKIFIASIAPGSLADRVQLFHVGDVVVYVNDVTLTGLSVEQVREVVRATRGDIRVGIASSFAPPATTATESTRTETKARSNESVKAPATGSIEEPEAVPLAARRATFEVAKAAPPPLLRKQQATMSTPQDSIPQIEPEPAYVQHTKKGVQRHANKLFSSSSAVPTTRGGVHCFLFDALDGNGLASKTNDEKHAKLLSVVAVCVELKRPFTDPEFPPNNSIIGAVDSSPILKHIQWLTPKDFAGPTTQLFSNPSPEDVYQGALGDCYFLSSLVVLSEHPNLIKNLFNCPPLGKYSRSDIERIGGYTVQFCIGGEWQTVIIDNYFPCGVEDSHPGSILPVFSRCPNPNDLWVLVAEKAWAKLHGTYHRAESGFAEMAMHCLTGAPTEFINLQTLDTHEKKLALWSKLYKNQELMIAAGISSDNNSLCRKVGFVPSHAYSILQLVEVQGEKLLQLRNPWGCHEWTGKWSESSSVWTPELKKELAYVDADDGIFWIDFEDFLNYILEIDLCYVQEGWSFANIPGSIKGEGYGKGVKFDVTTNLDVFISIQQLEAGLRLPDNDQTIYALGFDVFKMGDTGTLIDTCQTEKKERNWIRINLLPGSYIVVPILASASSQTLAHFQLVFYSSLPVAPVVLQDKTSQNKCVFDSFASTARKSGEGVHRIASAPETSLFTLESGPLSLRYYINRGKEILNDALGFDLANQTVMQIDPTGSTVLSSNKSGQFNLDLAVAAGSEKILVMRQSDVDLPKGIVSSSPFVVSKITAPSLRSLTKENGKSTLQESGINLTTLEYCNLYGVIVDNTTDKQMTAKLDFNFVNYQIASRPNQSSISWVLAPGKSQFVVLERISPSETATVDIIALAESS